MFDELYAALVALFNPTKLSLAQIAVLEQTNTLLKHTFSSILFWASNFPQEMAPLGQFYMKLDATPKMKDGDIPYPRPGYDGGIGMSVEFRCVTSTVVPGSIDAEYLYRNVSFNYPSAKTDRSALSDVSFTIQPGNLVVIVGSNGSGKTTIVKLLSRFYDVDSGSILIDGKPIQEYRMKELRKTIAMLTQEHGLFPVSIQENVGLGSPDKSLVRDTEKIRGSLRLSGAEHIVDNFSEGIDTVLDPVFNGYVSHDGDEDLEAIYNSFSKSASSVSGTFLHLSTA